eukprot:3259978-Rhodomonas_salina.2
MRYLSTERTAYRAARPLADVRVRAESNAFALQSVMGSWRIAFDPGGSGRIKCFCATNCTGIAANRI